MRIKLRMAAGMRLLVLVAVLATAAAASEQPSLDTPQLPPPTVFLHISDIHFSTNVRKYWNEFGDREGDATLFSEALVPRLGLAAAVVTGDITDSKVSGGA